VFVNDTGADCTVLDAITREPIVGAGGRSIQSTPLLGPAGQPTGALSTHSRKTGRPSVHELQMLDILARDAASLIERMFQPRGFPLCPFVPEDATLLQHVQSDDESFELFNRSWNGFSSWIEQVAGRENAMERLKIWSSRKSGQFVLFQGLTVIAVAENGVLDLRN